MPVIIGRVEQREPHQQNQTHPSNIQRINNKTDVTLMRD